MITEARDDARQLQVSHIEDSRHCAALPLRPGWKVRRVARQGRRSGRSRVRTRSWRRRRSVQRRRQRRNARGEVRRPWLRAQRDGARTGRAGRDRYWGAGHIRRHLTRDGRGRNTRRETRAIRVRRRRHDIRRQITCAVRVRPERAGRQMGTGQRITRSRQGLGRRRVRARVACDHRRAGMLRGTFQRLRPRRRSTVRESRAVRIGEPPCRQAGVTPELLWVDAALLERGVDERLQQPRGQQVDQQHLEVGAGRYRLGQRPDELASVDSVSTKSYLRSLRMSLMVCSCSSTWLRLGLSLIKPVTCAEN